MTGVAALSSLQVLNEWEENVDQKQITKCHAPDFSLLNPIPPHERFGVSALSGYAAPVDILNFTNGFLVCSIFCC